MKEFGLEGNKMILPALEDDIIDNDDISSTVNHDTGDIVTTSGGSISTAVDVVDEFTVGPCSGMNEAGWWENFAADRWMQFCLCMFVIWFFLEVIKILKGMV